MFSQAKEYANQENVQISSGLSVSNVFQDINWLMVYVMPEIVNPLTMLNLSVFNANLCSKLYPIVAYAGLKTV